MDGQKAVDQAFVFHDTNNLASFKAKGGDREALEMAAKQFESIFLQMLMKTMRDSNDLIAEGGMFSSNQQQFYQRMFDDQLTLSLSKNGQLGIADLIVQQLSGNLQGATSKGGDKQPAEAIVGADLQLPPGFTSLLENFRTQSTAVPASAEKRKKEVAAAELFPASSAKGSDRSPNAKKTKQDVEAEAAVVTSQEVKPQALDFSSPQAFVESLLPYAKKAASVLGFSPHFLLAQAALETGWGKHIMSDTEGNPSNNLFGIKAGKSWDGGVAVKDTLEFDGHQMKKERATFRAYSHVADSFMDYAQFITKNPRYEKARQNHHDAGNYFTELQAAGYATDPDYAEKILRILDSDAFQATTTN